MPLGDGTSRQHTPGRRGTGSGEYARCQGSGYRLFRWPVGQRLRHHTTGIWEVVEDRAATTRWSDYLIRCVEPTRSLSGDGYMEEPGRESVAHGEYMHRHGWMPVDDDCMCGHGFDRHDHRRIDAPCRDCDEPYECSSYEPDRIPPTKQEPTDAPA